MSAGGLRLATLPHACLDDFRVVCSHHRCQALEFRPKLREFRAFVIALLFVRGDLLLLFRNL
jgi:hypothetical protein